jgi:hypothetical protein
MLQLVVHIKQSEGNDGAPGKYLEFPLRKSGLNFGTSQMKKLLLLQVIGGWVCCLARVSGKEQICGARSAISIDRVPSQRNPVWRFVPGFFEKLALGRRKRALTGFKISACRRE